MLRRGVVISAVLLLALIVALVAGQLLRPARVPVFDTLHTSTRKVTAVLVTDEAVWVGTEGGCLRWQPGQPNVQKLTTRDGLPANGIHAIVAVRPAPTSPPDVLIATSRGLCVLPDQPGRGATPVAGVPLEGRTTAVCWAEGRAYAAAGTEVLVSDGVPAVEAAWEPLGAPLPADARCLACFGDSLWAGTAIGLFRWEEDAWQPVIHKDDPLAATVNALLPVDEALYVGTVGGLFRYRDRCWAEYTTRDGLPDNHITSLAARADAITIGTYGAGVVVLRDGEFRVIPGSAPYVTCVAVEPDGEGLWIGTEERGLFHWDGESWQKRFVLDEPPGHNITSLAAHNGQTWVATFEHGIGLQEEGTWRSFGSSDGLSSTWINHVAFGSGRAWARTSAGYLFVHAGSDWRQVTKKGSGIVKDWTSCVQSSGGHIWTGTWGAISKFDGSRWHNYAPKPALEGQVVTSVVVMGPDIWVGTAKDGLRRYNGRTGQWEAFNLGSGLTDTWVTCLAVWRGSLWVGTFGGGLCRYDGREWEPIRAAGPLPSDRINCLAATDALYVGTLDGLCRYDGDEWTTYTRADGLPSEIIQALAVSGDRLWVGTPEGLASARLVTPS
jgi:ligand-binding sensor domain-containing protein